MLPSRIFVHFSSPELRIPLVIIHPKMKIPIIYSKAIQDVKSFLLYVAMFAFMGLFLLNKLKIFSPTNLLFYFRRHTPTHMRFVVLHIKLGPIHADMSIKNVKVMHI